MTIIRVPITRLVDGGFPGWVEVVLTDAAGRDWAIIDKIPIFSNDDSLDENSEFPQPGELACEVLQEKTDAQDRKLAIITIERPCGLESEDGITIFEVLRETVEIA